MFVQIFWGLQGPVRTRIYWMFIVILLRLQCHTLYIV
jgi:hypothetical protein